jgi:hypothetical protein
MSTTTASPSAAVDTINPQIAEVIRLRQTSRLSDHHQMDPEADGLVRLELEHDGISGAMAQAVAKCEEYCADNSRIAAATECDRLVSGMTALTAQHASLEERFVYPLFKTHMKGKVQGISAEMIYERNVTDDDMNKVALDLLMQMRCQRDGPLMLATLKKFQMIEDEHLTQEEGWFRLLRSLMKPEDLRQLATTMRAAVVPTYPHSVCGPSHGPMAKVIHPLAGLLDKAVDTAMGREKLEEGPGGVRHVHGVEPRTQ